MGALTQNQIFFYFSTQALIPNFHTYINAVYNPSFSIKPITTVKIQNNIMIQWRLKTITVTFHKQIKEIWKLN